MPPQGFPGGASDEEPACQCRRCKRCKRCRFDPWVRKRGGSSNPLQSSCLESPLDRGAWRATVHGVAKSQTRLKRLSTHAPDEQISESHTRAQSQGHLSNVRGRDQVDSGARHKDLPPNPGSSGSSAALSRRTGSSRPPQNAVPTC